MPIPQLPGILNDPNADINALVQGIRDYQIRLERELQYMMQNGLDSTNLFEAGGFRVKPDTFMHKTGLVGMSSAGTAGSSIRFWAGDANPAIAPFRVQQDGTMYSTKGNIGGFVIGATSLTDVAGTFGLSSAVTAGDDVRFFAGNINAAVAPFRVTESGLATMIGALIQSAGVYPRIEFNSGSNIFAAYSSATDAVKLVPVYLSGPPAWLFDIAGSTRGTISLTTGSFAITTSGANNLNLQSSQDASLVAVRDVILDPTGNLKIGTTSGSTGSFVAGTTTVTVKKGIITSIV